MNADQIRLMLNAARDALSQGNPTLALDLVCGVVGDCQGQGAVFAILDRAKEQMKAMERAEMQQQASSSGPQSQSRGIAELASQLIRSLIIQPGPSSAPTPASRPRVTVDPALLERLTQGSLLGEQGRTGSFLNGALASGDSYICSRCQGVVNSERREAHETTWCPALDDDAPPSPSDSGRMCDSPVATHPGFGGPSLPDDAFVLSAIMQHHSDTERLRAEQASHGGDMGR